jgi:VanZ family protein
LGASRLWKAWIPVLVWLVIIACESTERMGAAHTSGLILQALLALHVHISTEHLELINHVLRKCGHFFGYGILAVLFVRAWLLTLRPSLKGQPLLARCITFGLTFTLLVATADEVHQHFLQGRTSSPVDVALDMTGAVLLAGAASGRLRRISYSD